MVNFGEKIKSLRTQRNLTQKQLADLSGVAISAISSYEAGNRYPSYDVLISLARIFHVSTDYLLGLENLKTVDVSGLEDRQINVILQMIDIMKEKNLQIK